MQRLFSSFPDGRPGAGLLLLRLAAAAAMVLQAQAWLDRPWQSAIALVIAGCVLAGFMTPLAAIGAAAVSVFGSAPYAFAIAAALALLGPGAFSVDAKLFGRREIVI